MPPALKRVWRHAAHTHPINCTTIIPQLAGFLRLFLQVDHADARGHLPRDLIQGLSGGGIRFVRHNGLARKDAMSSNELRWTISVAPTVNRKDFCTGIAALKLEEPLFLSAPYG
jgi:hypothetical protein